MRLLTQSVLATIAFLMFCNSSIADGWQVDNIWWNLILNYDNSGMDVCIAENFNSKTVYAIFDVFPADNRVPPRPLHAKSYPTLPPYIQVRFYGWIQGFNGDLKESCILQSWHY